MARKAAQAEETAMTKWDAEFAAMAEEQAEQVATIGGGRKFLSFKNGLYVDGNRAKDDQLAVVILDSVLLNAYYEGAYNPDSPSSPACYAFGRKEEGMVPSPDCESPQADACKGCPQNEFGSAATGKGKACKNGIRIAVIAAGNIDPSSNEFQAFEDSDELAKGEVWYANIPATSMKNFASYVQNLKAVSKRPTFGVFTLLSRLDDDKTQFKVAFENLGPVPAELAEIVTSRHKAEKDVIAFPFMKASEREEPAPAPRKATRAPSRPAAAKPAAAAPAQRAQPAAAAPQPRARKF